MTKQHSLISGLIDEATRISGLSKKKLAKQAGLAPETLSRICQRGTGDFGTVLKAVKAAGLELTARRPGAVADNAAQPDGKERLATRSLVLHALAAGKLLANPSLVENRVLPTIRRFSQVHAGTGTLRLLEVWERAARAGVNEVVQLCTDPSEEARQLRQASPITGILLPSERRRVYEAFTA